MAIETVTSENLAEYVKSRPDPQAIAAAAETAKAEEAKSVVKGTGEETISTAPDPGKQPTDEEKKARKPKNDVQARIDELVRERHELDEAFQSEYEQRLRLEGELNSLKSREQSRAEPAKADLQPDPEKYTDQKLFLKEYGEWVARQARAEFAKEQDKARAEEQMRAAEAAMVKKIANAKADLSDFEDVIDRADKRTRGDIPNHIKAAIYESDVGAHIAYHLAKNPDEEKRIFALPAAKALLELGKIESTYVSKGTPAAAAALTPKTPTPETKTPEPVARLKEGAGVIQTDLAQPMDFKSYRSARIEQIRASGRRRH